MGLEPPNIGCYFFNGLPAVRGLCIRHEFFASSTR